MNVAAALFSAACHLFGAGCDLPPPTLVYVSQDWLQEHACPSGRCGSRQFWGWYNDEGTVYLWIDAPRGAYFDGVVVHEIIHYLQHALEGPTGQCERERQAYALQQRYLVSQRGVMPLTFMMC